MSAALRQLTISGKNPVTSRSLVTNGIHFLPVSGELGQRFSLHYVLTFGFRDRSAILEQRWMSLGGPLTTILSVSHSFSLPPWLLHQHRGKGGRRIKKRPTDIIFLKHGPHLSMMACPPSLGPTKSRISQKARDTPEVTMPTILSSTLHSYQSVNPLPEELGLPEGPREQTYR